MKESAAHFSSPENTLPFSYFSFQVSAFNIIRQQDRVLPGQEFAIERLEEGEYLLRRIDSGENAGVVDWLLDCPAKGWFRKIESESPDVP
jgi:hypothetical protein